eukprot:TRINITY_DN12754_c0_g1_i5.p1 TRINITY_DN12754_c0_g1~~TRINITY_DN12754_c0_g1_i5.p1  ORF type:complete len:294 (+),score=59.81 TRINITY_DN12754_c0_g1_i5:30-884(+)
MAKVSLHVYDVTNSPNVKTNNAIIQINKITRDTMGIGGIFHGAVEVFGEEWSYGYCERGTGVFSCPPMGNPMYTFRETVELGVTPFDERKVHQLLVELSRQWDGQSYDLLARNCNHFCDEFCRRLGAGPIPFWINRFAIAGDTAVEVAGRTAEQVGRLRADAYTLSLRAYSLVFGSDSNGSSVSPEPLSDSSYATATSANGQASVHSEIGGQKKQEQQLLIANGTESSYAMNGPTENGNVEAQPSTISRWLPFRGLLWTDPTEAATEEKRRTSLPVCPALPPSA